MMKKSRSRILWGCLCAVGCETLFGLSYICTKGATLAASALTLLGWRFFVAAAFMALCAASGRVQVRWKGKPRKPLLAVALCNPVVYFVAETIGISRTTASESGAFLACIPAVSLLASTLLLDKSPQKHQVVGIAVTLAGVLTAVLAAGASASFSLSGYAVLTIAVLSYALYSVSVEKAAAYTGAELTAAMMAAGAAVFIPLALAEGWYTETLAYSLCLPLTNSAFLAAVLYQGVGCSVLAFFLSNIAIASIGVNRTASFIGISTVVSIVAGVTLLGETFSLMQTIGVAVILAGVYIANANIGKPNGM